MIAECEHTDVCETSNAFPASFKIQLYRASSVTRRPASFASSAGENGLRQHPARLIRPEDMPSTRSALRGHADRPGAGDSPPRLHALRQGEAGEAGLTGGQPVLHQALHLLRGTALPEHDDQEPRCAVHALAVATGGEACAKDGRDRRDLDTQGAHLPNRGQRLGTAKVDLVRRQRPIGREHGCVL